MTADIDVHADVSEVNEKCALDMSTYENLPKPCNAASIDFATAIPKDDTDGSYVFVTSTDDHVTEDLNAQEKYSQNADTEIKVQNEEFSVDDATKSEQILVDAHVSDALEDSLSKISENVKESDAIQDEIRAENVLQPSDTKVDEAESGVDSSQKVEETRTLEDRAINESFDTKTNSGGIHGLESPVEVQDSTIEEENQIHSTSESSNTDASLSGKIVVESSQVAEDVQTHEDNGTVAIMKSSDTQANHGIEIEEESSQKADHILSHKANETVAIKFSDTEANPGEEIEVESSQKADDIQNNEENGIVKAPQLSVIEANPTGDMEVESSKKAADIENHEENGIVKAPKLSDTEANPRGEIEAAYSKRADNIENQEESGMVKAPKLSDIEMNPRGEIEVESSQEVEDVELNRQNEIVDAIHSSSNMDWQGSEVIPEDNETVPISELSDTINSRGEETEMRSFEREEGTRESQDANLEAANCNCVGDKEKVDEMENKSAVSYPVEGIGESQITSMGSDKSELDQPDDSVEDIKGECNSGLALIEENSERTQITISQDGENYQVVAEELESSNNEVSLLEPSEENKVDMEHEQHLAAAPCQLVNLVSEAEDANGDQDDHLETIDDKDTVANKISFHDNTKTSSTSVDSEIAIVENHKLSPTVLISNSKVEVNGITMDKQEVDHVLELEENSETASHPKVDECVKVDVSEGTVSEKGDHMPTALNESRISDGDDSVAGSQLIPEGNEPVESIKTTLSAVVIGNASAEVKERSSIHCLNDPVMQPDLEVEDCTMSENVASAADDVQPDKEVSGNHEIGLIGNSNFEIKCENGQIEKDNQSTFPSNDMGSESKVCTSIGCEEIGSTVSEVPNGVSKSSVIQQNSVVDTDSELHDNEISSVLCPTADEKSGDDIEITSSIGDVSRDLPGDDCNVSKIEVLKGSLLNNEGVLNPISDNVVETDNKPTKEESEVIHEGCQNEPPSSISPEGSLDASEGQNVAAEAATKPFYFLIRVPRYDDDSIREQIKRAQTEVDRKTKDRDAIRVQIQTMRATWKVLSDNLEAAVSEGRAARDLLKSKRQEIDSVQSVITKVKNAMSVEDIDGRIRNIEHMIEHETLPLKEEKQLIREIKQLKQLREQLSSTMGKQDELQQALDQKDQIEERLKLLRKEMDVLRDNVLKAETVIKAAKKKYNDENVKMDELQSQFKAADKIRQEAYANLQSLRKQLYEKNKYFWKYRDDVKEANELALSGDRERLQHLCVKQAESMVELWNKNAEFREDYIRCNTRSTLRRLRTLDGRSLGPNEEPPVWTSIAKERPVRDNSLPMVSTTREPEKLIPADSEKDNDKPATKIVETKNQTTKNKKPNIEVALANSHRNISSENEVEEPPRPEEIKRTREEEEMAAKAEELRKEEEAAKLKEQRKLEEKTKAKEALERKKRNAEKAQARAVIKARKEAEEREKQKEKRAKKKERKMAAATEGGDGIGCDERETPSEAVKESENTSKQATAAPKRSQKPLQYTKQSKTTPIPPPLRNRGKRRMNAWMWVILTTLVVFVLFLVGQQRLLY